MSDELREVPAADRVDAVERAVADGYGFADWLGCVDEIGRSDELRVVVRLVHLPDLAAVRLSTRVPRDGGALPTLRHVLPGLAWHEREARDLFGVRFVGGDERPLFVRGYGAHPLRKDEVLAARAVTPWPGGKEPGESVAAPSRRRMVPPGVPDPEVWGDRDPAEPAPDAADVATSAVGGRVRRRAR